MNPKILKNPYFYSAKMAPKKVDNLLTFKGANPLTFWRPKCGQPSASPAYIDKATLKDPRTSFLCRKQEGIPLQLAPRDKNFLCWVHRILETNGDCSQGLARSSFTLQRKEQAKPQQNKGDQVRPGLLHVKEEHRALSVLTLGRPFQGRLHNLMHAENAEDAQEGVGGLPVQSMSEMAQP